MGFAGSSKRKFSIAVLLQQNFSFWHIQSRSGGSRLVFLSLQPAKRVFLELRPGHWDQRWAAGLCLP